jgi:hypothetical protein
MGGRWVSLGFGGTGRRPSSILPPLLPFQTADTDDDGRLNLVEFETCIIEQLRLWKLDQTSNTACTIS